VAGTTPPRRCARFREVVDPVPNHYTRATDPSNAPARTPRVRARVPLKPRVRRVRLRVRLVRTRVPLVERPNSVAQGSCPPPVTATTTPAPAQSRAVDRGPVSELARAVWRNKGLQEWRRLSPKRARLLYGYQEDLDAFITQYRAVLGELTVTFPELLGLDDREQRLSMAERYSPEVAE
jgi:hypothetical protein